MAEADPRFRDLELKHNWSWSDSGKIYVEDEELVLSSQVLYRPTLTVELRTKWYQLFLLHLTRGDNVKKEIDHLKVYSLHFGHLDKVIPPHGISAYSDHVPNPIAVNLFARRNNFEVDELALDLIAGRWQQEVVGFLSMECDRCGGKGEVPFALNDVSYSGRCASCRKCRGLGVLMHGE